MSSEFNIGYFHSGCIKLLARLGFKYRKPKTLPRVSDVEKQAAFIAFYENLLNNLPADEAVYFSDAGHPDYQSKPSHSNDIRPRPREHSRRSEPGNLLRALC